ncbi:hypothetical protein ERJ75_000875300 [Trypanosoma vivax]|nr:hypothetical protein ERJ75_000875300 [Trypanosoma vivax]
MLQLVCEAGHGLGNRGKRSSRNSFHLLPSNYSQETTLSGRSYAFKALEPSILPALRSTPSHGTAVFNATAKEMLPDNRTEDTAAWRMEMQRIIELFQPCSAATADHSDCDGDAYVCPEDVCASKRRAPLRYTKTTSGCNFSKEGVTFRGLVILGECNTAAVASLAAVCLPLCTEWYVP